MAELLGRIWAGIRGLSREQAVGLVAATGVTAYALLYLAYFQFYAPFGLRPSDVGLSRTRLVEESLLGLVLVPYGEVRAHPWALVLVVGAVVVGRVVWEVSRTRKAPPHRELAATAVVAVLVFVLSATVGGYVGLVVEARALGDDVRQDGRIVVSWVNRRTVVYLPYLDVQAIPVEVVGGDAATRPALTPGCTVYLGRADGTAVLLDVPRREVVRLPLDGVTLVFRPALRDHEDERLPRHCWED